MRARGRKFAIRSRTAEKRHELGAGRYRLDRIPERNRYDGIAAIECPDFDDDMPALIADDFMPFRRHRSPFPDRIVVFIGHGGFSLLRAWCTGRKTRHNSSLPPRAAREF